MEVLVLFLIVSRQNGFTPQEYSEAMMELESVDSKRMQACNHMLVQKNKVAQTYYKRVKRKCFEVGDVIWKIILPIRLKCLLRQSQEQGLKIFKRLSMGL